ncbi:unnamed protein product [Strongylus vulgaris]|uniref:Uncharacterized protein n=1 Tax=Strongylus vulgaris TaxID=40348 RepID=A0A3P7LSB1_STRVU|nr:unnamed protein product [Strongylus vulgaris]
MNPATDAGKRRLPASVRTRYKAVVMYLRFFVPFSKTLSLLNKGIPTSGVISSK